MSGASDFFSYARKRYDVYLRRQNGEKWPWTSDKVLQEYRFCNVFREDDATTKWFRENVRDRLAESPDLLQATIIFRWFNNVRVGQALNDAGLLENWNSSEAETLLRHMGPPFVTGAYMIKTPAGMDKVDGLIWCIEQVLPDCHHLQSRIEPGDTTIEGVTEALQGYPYLGPFMAYEVVCDLYKTPLLGSAPDVMTWANPGPGAARGYGRVVERGPDTFDRHSKKDQATLIEGMRHLLALSREHKNWPNVWPEWDMRTVEHTLCEFDKYERVLQGGGSKRRYSHAEKEKK